MKKLSLQKTCAAVAAFLLILLTAGFTNAQQVKYHTKDDLNLLISGTSTLHDWDMKSAKGEVTAMFTQGTAGQLTTLNTLTVVIPADGLKSGHSGMDNNAYKALKTDKNPNITYVLTNAGITVADANNYTVKCLGKLTIAGATVDADVIATVKINADKSISVSGTKKISMKDFKMEPPTFLMGTIKTGNDIVLKFDLTIRK